MTKYIECEYYNDDGTKCSYTTSSKTEMMKHLKNTHGLEY